MIPLPEPVKPESIDIKTVIIREKLARQNLKAFGIADFNAIDLKTYGFSNFARMDKEDVRDFFKEYYTANRDAIEKNLLATECELRASLKKSVDSKQELRQMLKDARSFHIDSVLNDEFVNEVYQRIQGIEKRPVTESKPYSHFAVVLGPP